MTQHETHICATDVASLTAHALARIEPAHEAPEQSIHAQNTDSIFFSLVRTAYEFVPCTGCLLSVHDISTHAVRVISSCGLSPPLAGRAINAITTRLSPKSAIDLNIARAQLGTPILQANLLWNGRQQWILSVVRNSKYWTFKKQDIVTLRKLQLMFQSVLKEQSQAFALYRACWSVVDQLTSGIALLYADGTVAGANESAWALLDGQRGIGIRHGKLSCADPADMVRLRMALDDLKSAHGGECHPILISGELPDQRLQISLIKLSEPYISMQAISIAALVTDPLRPTGPTTAYLQELYRLTRVEAEVVQLICQGSCPQEVAAKMKISVHTVRGYLKSIFAKTGVHRQADIVRIVANAPHLTTS